MIQYAQIIRYKKILNKSVLLSFLLFSIFTGAQEDFVQQCEGVWTGTMYIYANGQKAADAPKITFTVMPIVKDSSWVWRTDYDSQKFGKISKDYKLLLRDATTGYYQLDEGDGLYLDQHLVANKMYSVFEVQNIALSASYELRGEELIFEVISSPKSQDSTEVRSHPVRNVQRVVLKKTN